MEGYFELEKKHFIYFVNACKGFISFLGLVDWEVRYFFQEGDEDDPKACMGVEDYGNRLAAIFIFDQWDAPPTPRNLWMVAFHEVLELFMSDTRHMAESREFNALLYDREHHRIIRMLENSVFLDMWENKNELFDIQSTTEVPECTEQEISEVHRNKTLFGDDVPDSE